MTSSDAGIYGLGGQSNFASSKLAMYGFGMTLAKEGAKKNVLCNVIAPVANTRLGSALFASSVPQSQLEALFKPELVAPMVAFLCHDASANTGGVYEIGGGAAAMVRRERGAGALLKVNDEGFTPGAVSAVFEQACDFREPVHPASITEVDWVGLVEKSMGLQSNPKGSNLRFENRVALVTGSGAGIGKAYAMLFAKYGAKVVINDISKAAADAVVEEIKRAGGDAFAVAESVENGQQIIDQVMQHYGRLDILVNNAGILRDKSFTKMTDREWDQVIGIHLYGTYKMTRAAWPIMMKQNYGRIINVSSAVGLYGNFGQANYSSGTMVLLGV